jgi:hypothetical protein
MAAISEPWELRSYVIGGHGPYLLIHPQQGPDPDKTALRLSEQYVDRAVVLFMPELYDQVPGLGRVARGGPEGAEVVKVYVNKKPELKVGNAVDNEVAYPVPEVSRERAPLVLQSLRAPLGVYHSALERILTGPAIEAGIDVVEVISAISFPGQTPGMGTSLNFVHRDAPLARNTP